MGIGCGYGGIQWDNGVSSCDRFARCWLISLHAGWFWQIYLPSSCYCYLEVLLLVQHLPCACCYYQRLPFSVSFPALLAQNELTNFDQSEIQLSSFSKLLQFQTCLHTAAARDAEKNCNDKGLLSSAPLTEISRLPLRDPRGSHRCAAGLTFQGQWMKTSSLVRRLRYKDAGSWHPTGTLVDPRSPCIKLASKQIINDQLVCQALLINGE